MVLACLSPPLLPTFCWGDTMNVYFAPLPDTESSIMRPIDPLLSIEDGYGSRPGTFGVNLGIAPVDPMFPSDIFTPTVDIFAPGSHGAAPALGGLPEMLDVFNAARFLFEG